MVAGQGEATGSAGVRSPRLGYVCAVWIAGSVLSFIGL